jgi:protein-L-isoaspartate O-methyltransferase
MTADIETLLHGQPFYDPSVFSAIPCEIAGKIPGGNVLDIGTGTFESAMDPLAMRAKHVTSVEPERLGRQLDEAENQADFRFKISSSSKSFSHHAIYRSSQ